MKGLNFRSSLSGETSLRSRCPMFWSAQTDTSRDCAWDVGSTSLGSHPLGIFKLDVQIRRIALTLAASAPQQSKWGQSWQELWIWAVVDTLQTQRVITGAVQWQTPRRSEERSSPVCTAAHKWYLEHRVRGEGECGRPGGEEGLLICGASLLLATKWAGTSVERFTCCAEPRAKRRSDGLI